ncbi:MAG: hypothetical protein LBI10_05070 [Deltaproteobacteria bacterium]|nr:hypothetical protein [Deltaproteobacteria bacterium]
MTDTEKPPTLLWRFTDPQLGLVVARPVVSRSDQNFMVIVGSGPTYDLYDPNAKTTEPGPEGRLAYRGYSNQSAKLFVFDAIKGPGTKNSGVMTIESGRPKSFIAQSFIAIAPADTVRVDSNGQTQWRNVLAYFSLNQAAPDDRLLCLRSTDDLDPFLNYANPEDRCGPSSYGPYGFLDKGGVYRLNMAGDPSAWANNFKLFFEADRPISGAVNATTDPKGNVWVIFGSGRYFHDEDSRLCEGAGNVKECRLNHINYLYGIKEPRLADGSFSFGSVSDQSLTDVSNVYVYPNGSIRVLSSGGVSGSLGVPGGTVDSYANLVAYLASDKTGGYKKALHTQDASVIDGQEIGSPNDSIYDQSNWWKGLSAEMLIQQVAIANFWGQSHMAFSSFLPENVACGSAGKSYHILLDTFTGLPSPVMGSALFLAYNRTQDMVGLDSSGDKPISDHYSYAEGMNVPTTVVTTYINGQAKTAFVTTTSSGVGGGGNLRHNEKSDPLNLGGGGSSPGGSQQAYVEPVAETPKGVVSWREVLDHSILE